MKKVNLKIPLGGHDVEKLRLGDVVYLSGTVFTARDMAHKRMKENVERGKRIPFSLEGAALFHAGPIVRGKEIIAIGSTTSARMDEYAPLVFKLGVRALIGKGGMGKEGREAVTRFGCVYLAWPGGCAAVGREFFKTVKVYWEELGMAEAVWELKAKNFGPLIVGIDSTGCSLYDEVLSAARKKLGKGNF